MEFVPPLGWKVTQENFGASREKVIAKKLRSKCTIFVGLRFPSVSI